MHSTAWCTLVYGLHRAPLAGLMFRDSVEDRGMQALELAFCFRERGLRIQDLGFRVRLRYCFIIPCVTQPNPKLTGSK